MSGSRPVPDRLPGSPPTHPPTTPCPVHSPFHHGGRVYYDEHIRHWHFNADDSSPGNVDFDYPDRSSNYHSPNCFLLNESLARDWFHIRNKVRSQMRVMDPTDPDGINPFDHQNEATLRRYGVLGQLLTREQANAHRRWRHEQDAIEDRLWREQRAAIDAVRRAVRDNILLREPIHGHNRRDGRCSGGRRHGPNEGPRSRSRNRAHQGESNRSSRNRGSDTESVNTRAARCGCSQASTDGAAHGGAYSASRHVHFTPSTDQAQ